ncbi:MAG: ribonuclease H-like domain-containing protein [Lachnospiraceae bacterium]|nr:ribonuclease H-like domain-containing protein [Lachnospiraceae bacterium]
MKKELLSLSGVPFFMPEGVPFAALDIDPTTRFYRTSLLSRVFLIKGGPLPDSPLTEIIYSLEQESDDFDILEDLAKELKDTPLLITYNGKAFDLPHLKKKCELYRIPSFVSEKRCEDLMLTLRPYARLFSLRTRRLSDYVSLLPENENLTDNAQRALAATSLRAFAVLVQGGFSVKRGSCLEGEAFFELAPKVPIPCRLSFSEDPFSLSASPEKTELRALLQDGLLRRYYRDYKSYRFLTHEGYAVHRSVAEYVGSDRQKKATRENCYSYVKCSEKFLSNPESMKSYVLSALIWLSRI